MTEKRWAALEQLSDELDDEISALMNLDLARIWDDVARYIQDDSEHFRTS